MSAIVLQRYLLAASTTIGSIPAGVNGFAASVTTPRIPLGATWTIRLRKVDVAVQNSDGLAGLQLLAILPSWQLQGAQNQVLFSIDVAPGPFTPSFVFPASGGGGSVVNNVGEMNQTVSSLDQVGGIATSVVAAGGVLITNADGANPHTFRIFLSAIMEFEAPGSSE
jgi:hypothetical protein